VQVTVKLAAVIVAGAILLVKIAVTARLLGTPVVGPGIVVAGAVENTRGRVTSTGVPTVVNFQVYGPVIAMPLARLVAPVIVTLYSVPVARAVPDVSVKVATVLVAFRVTTPVGFAHGATHVTVMLATPEIGAIDSLNVAVTRVLVSTPVAPFAGVTEVTAGARAVIPLVPRMPSLPQAAANAPSVNAINHVRHRGRLSMMFMCIPSPYEIGKTMKQWSCWRDRRAEDCTATY
jgi:hypothetical protein